VKIVAAMPDAVVRAIEDQAIRFDDLDVGGRETVRLCD
jgi:hypothetical protein